MTILTKLTVPACMEAWLNIPFYSGRCRIHPKQYNTVYCGACMQRPVCPVCWRLQSHPHDSHDPILTVRIATNRAAIDEKQISAILDVSDIVLYKINDKDVVYLNPAGEPVPASQTPTCRSCSRRFKKSVKYDPRIHYCSIACKIMMEKRMNRRSRKSKNPRRAPFF